MIDRRLKVADMTGQGMTPEQIKDELGYSSTQSVYKAQSNPAVNEQIKWHRDNLFEQSRIDRVKLLRELYERATEPTGDIFKTLRGEGQFLDAANLEKLTPLQSRLIQQIDIEPTLIKQLVDGQVETLTTSVVKKIRFHSPDAALKILSKAAGFEDGLPTRTDMEAGGPFRGLNIIPPKEVIDRSDCGMEPSEQGPPENPI